MRVLFWMHTSFDTTSKHLLTAILEKLDEKKAEITVLFNASNIYSDIPEQLKNLNIKFIPIFSGKVKKQNLISRFFNEIKYYIRCSKFIDNRYDSVFIQSSNIAGLQTFILKKKAPNAKITFNIQDFFPYNAYFSGKIRQGFFYYLFKKIQIYALHNVNNIITISEDIRELLIHIGIEKSKINVIYNWTYQDKIFQTNDNNLSIIDKKYFNVVYAGNIGVMQNVELILNAAIKLKKERDILFTIIGDGVNKDKLIKLAEKQHLTNVRFFPFQTNEIATQIYSIADINIIPLRKDIFKTALPSKTATCLACCKPIILAIGSESIFGRKLNIATNCPVIDSDDYSTLTEKIIKIKNKELLCNTKQYFENNFSKTQNSSLYSKIILDEYKEGK